MLAIEGASVIDGDVVGDNLILTKHDGTQINAGSVRGPAGPQGPIGSDLVVIAAKPVLDVGIVNQIRAGRQLGPADFNAIGLSAPLGLWNLSDLSDVSGNGRNLQNKGAVPFDTGINGIVSTAARFSGNTAQALYIVDTGAADPFRIKTGSIGCWFRTAKRATVQYLMAKWGSTIGVSAWGLYASSGNIVGFTNSDGSGSGSTAGVSDVCDDRWHFTVITFDASVIRLYLDGLLEGESLSLSLLNPNASAPLNIGSAQADGATVANGPSFGRVDEAFITADILTEEQVRTLYCAKIPHTLGAVPSRSTLNIRRRRRGAALAVSDFPTQPLRLYNFSAGSLGDEGSNGQALVNSGAAPVLIAGADGTLNNAFRFGTAANTSFQATDAGLPAAFASRSYGFWFKTTYVAASGVIMGWGTQGNGDARIYMYTTGQLRMVSGSDDTNSGMFNADGLWHHCVVVEDNTALDAKRKMYVDGRMVITSNIMASIALLGANRFKIGVGLDGSNQFIGDIDGVFICGYALTAEQIMALYAKGTQTLAPSPKNAGDHIEAFTSTDILATFDSLDTSAQVDLKVAA
jgi:hypothetical protein